MAEIKVTRGRCVYWRGCSAPRAKGSRFCAFHGNDRVCRKCQAISPPKLTQGMCMRCYSWWRRHESPARQQILARDRERSAAARARRQVAA